MKNYPPKLNDELLLEAFAKFAKNFEDCDVQTLVDAYNSSLYGDGFEIAKYLDVLGWDIVAADVEQLDELAYIADEALRKARQKWVEDNNIQPEYEIGTVLTKGVIVGIDTYSPATYLVKEFDGDDNRKLLIKFEEAKLKNE